MEKLIYTEIFKPSSQTIFITTCIIAPLLKSSKTLTLSQLKDKTFRSSEKEQFFRFSEKLIISAMKSKKIRLTKEAPDYRLTRMAFSRVLKCLWTLDPKVLSNVRF
jgi:hypothetical protein